MILGISRLKKVESGCLHLFLRLSERVSVPSSFNLVVLGGGNPDDEVGPEAEDAADEGEEEDDADDGGVDVEILGDAAADTGNLAVGEAAGEATIAVVFHIFFVF